MKHSVAKTQFTQCCSPGGDGEDAPGWQKYPGEQGPEGAVRPGEPQNQPGGHSVQLESCQFCSLRGTEEEFQLAALKAQHRGH